MTEANISHPWPDDDEAAEIRASTPSAGGIPGTAVAFARLPAPDSAVWRAYLPEVAHIGGTGATPEEAAGWLMLNHPGRFGVGAFAWLDRPPVRGATEYPSGRQSFDGRHGEDVGVIAGPYPMSAQFDVALTDADVDVILDAARTPSGVVERLRREPYRPPADAGSRPAWVAGQSLGTGWGVWPADDDESPICRIPGPPDRPAAEAAELAARIAGLPELEAACRAFVALFRESDMRPEDECHEVFGMMVKALTRKDGHS